MEMLLSRIDSESRRMAGLVEDLLLLAQLDAQRPVEYRRVEPRVVDGPQHVGRDTVAPAGRVSSVVRERL